LRRLSESTKSVICGLLTRGRRQLLKGVEGVRSGRPSGHRLLLLLLERAKATNVIASRCRHGLLGKHVSGTTKSVLLLLRHCGRSLIEQ
jgi:hypothetical protein